MSEPLQIDGGTLTVNDQGVELKYGWLVNQQISTADAIKMRDWLNLNFPVPKGTSK